MSLRVRKPRGSFIPNEVCCLDCQEPPPALPLLPALHLPAPPCPSHSGQGLGLSHRATVLCHVCLAALTPATLNHERFPHITVPSHLLFPLSGLPFFMSVRVSYLPFQIQFRCHFCEAFPRTFFPPTGPVASLFPAPPVLSLRLYFYFALLSE